MKVNFPITNNAFVLQRTPRFSNKPDKLNSNSGLESFKYALNTPNIWEKHYNDSDNSVSLCAIMTDIPGYVITSDGSVWRDSTMIGEPAKKIIEKEPCLAEYVEVVKKEQQILNKINVLA